MRKLKLWLFGIKPKGNDIQTLGVRRSVVPKEYVMACQHWDRHLFNNIDYI